MTKMIVTGANSFVGSRLIQFCKLKKITSSSEITGVVRNPCKESPSGGFISYEDYWSQSFCVNGVVHVAAKVHQPQTLSAFFLEEYRRINRDLTLRVGKKSIEEGIRKFVFISSAAVFGRFRGGTLMDKDFVSPDDPYGLTKWEAEQGLAELFSKQSEAQCIILRLPMVYGPGNKGNMRPLLEIASKKIPLPLSCAQGKRSMIYVENFCDAIVKILQDEATDRPTVQTYFLNDSHDLTSSELYALIFSAYHGKKGVFPLPEMVFRFGGEVGSRFEELFGKQLPLNNEVVSRLFDEYRFSCESFCQDYDWKPPYTPEEGIQETVKWHQFWNREQWTELT
ncbi:NAD-dependent epimerase/dehydratase family protein [Deltaproteobacteria bacterium TL4]